jgi:AbrB family looped-hinge helix DNA binding protein
MIREKTRMKEKTVAYVQAREKEDQLVISGYPPEGTYNKIKISEKGQLVIPKNLRESRSIEKGNNLVFTIASDRTIVVKKLEERKTEKEKNWHWDFFIEVFGTLQDIPSLDATKIEEKALTLTFKKGQEPKGAKLLDLITKLESKMETRLLVQKDGSKIILRPMT